MATIEDVQRYWDSNPCNLRHSDKPVGSREYFDEVERRKYFVEPHIPMFADFGRWKGKRVLEIGCGIGTDTVNFLRAGAKVCAVDLSMESLKLAQQRCDVFGVSERVQFVLRDAEKLLPTWRAAEFDLAYAFGVLHHTPNPGLALVNIRGFLDHSGILKLMLYNRWSIKGLRVMLGARSEASEGCPVTHLYSKRSARRLLEAHGFEVESMTVEHIFPWRISDYRNFRYVKNWWYRWMPGWMFRGLEHLVGWHLCITARKV